MLQLKITKYKSSKMYAVKTKLTLIIISKDIKFIFKCYTNNV